MRSARPRQIIVLCLLILFPVSGFAQAITVRIAKNDPGRIFEGAGGVSAGASSRLLYDYEEPYRSQILDYLFKPDFGANLQHLKVEIGCDANTTCGSEPSHARNPEEMLHPVYTRGYEYWLMAEAKKRNPDIIINALEWGVPAYILSHWTETNARYIVDFIRGAEKEWGLKMDYISPGRNEDAISRDWLVKVFKPVLDSEGFSGVKILAPDDNTYHWEIFEYYKDDLEYLDIIDAVGYHYVNKARRPSGHTTDLAKASGKALWASEDWSGTGEWKDAYHLAWLMNIFYVRDRITMTSVWPPIDAIYNNLPHNDKGLMSADTPWSGHYQVEPPVWIMAHTNQFAKWGWQYLNSACDTLANGGNFVSLKDPESNHFSTIIVNGSSAQDFEFDLSGWGRVKKVQVRYTDSLSSFKKLDMDLQSGVKLRLSCAPYTIYSLTTLNTPEKGSYDIPENKTFPLPYAEDFEQTALTHPGRYFADVEGSFEVIHDPVQGNCLRQMLTEVPVDWVYDFVYQPLHPVSIIGESVWKDYEAICRVMIEEKGRAGIHCRINSDCSKGMLGYQFNISELGIWELKRDYELVATGYYNYQAEKWYQIALSCRGNILTAKIDGKEVVSYKEDRIRSGMAGISTSYDAVRFDDFQIKVY